jgi:ABC-type glycerol-3-phosphate transport system substrate-binding protein
MTKLHQQQQEQQQSSSTRVLQTTDADSAEKEQQDSCCSTCQSNDEIRIVTWSKYSSILQSYVSKYNTINAKDNPNNNRTKIIVTTVPSLADLNTEIKYDLKATNQHYYDGFVVPPMFVGDMLLGETKSLATWSSEELSSSSSSFDDLLPYYKYQVAQYGDYVRSLPLFHGSQMMVLFRKDYLDAVDLSTPKTWSDWIRIASILHNEPLGPNGQPIYGSCLGYINEDACRKRMAIGNNDNNTNSCNSQSMTYLGMMLSSMTQVDGNKTGWMLNLNESNPSGLDPMFEPTLETIITLMEQQIKFGIPNALDVDSTESLQLFAEGRCALTVTSNHNHELLNQDMVGFTALPSSHQYLIRERKEMADCTTTACPYGVDYEDWGRVNSVPFGSVTDATVGAVSAYVSESHQYEVKRFFDFVMSTKLQETDFDSPTLYQQPLTYSELVQSDTPGYRLTIKALTGGENAATPFRTPNAFGLLSELDNKVYSYLASGDYNQERRQQVASSLTKSWQTMIQMHDAIGYNLPTSLYYAKSTGIFIPDATSDLYIGWVARGIGWGLGGFTCLFSLFLALFVFNYRNNRVIRGKLVVGYS